MTHRRYDRYGYAILAALVILALYGLYWWVMR